MTHLLERFSAANPLTLKALSLLPSYRVFRDTYTLLQRSQRWSREDLEAYQRAELARLLEHAYEHVPYYRRVFDERSLKPADIHDFTDLRLLPFLTKEIVQNNLEDLRATNFPESAFEYVRTSGSTGAPMGFYYEKGVSRAKEWAFMKAQWDRVGYRFIDKCVVLRGHVVDSARSGVFWKKAMFGRWLIMSSHQMTEENLPAYIRRIRKFAPKYIHAYPSMIVTLARCLRQYRNRPFPSLKAILCGSENLYPWQRELIEEVFGCRVYSWYGNSEQTVLAGECEMSSCYHIFPEYGIVELLGKDDQPVMEPGQMGEVVATSLTNYICPLIRYRTMDIAVLSRRSCTCGRAYPLLEKVEGRLQEFIVTRKGQLVSVTPINYESDAFENIRQFQMYQEEMGELILKIVRKPGYTESDTERLQQELEWQLGDEVRVAICFVDSIPRTRSGKYRYLIQKLPIEVRDLHGGA
ncbi:phenylacetate--CoA ligase family protein [Methanoculleus sp. FWC-SCC1]|uniref:Phenylacetate--CoA ligase family protein n=1 Tax=Methanoculleus frigidifontis TaxID=2584085 RepID=A0ABT8MDX1_9EURY|nr:AMP-binding protein [Methanoculleus sp. FWC-SCC1]MDN7026086.1 phenylacetate--CoA ligase family protein [Methanoculleus sp. FWC-SCC1]